MPSRKSSVKKRPQALRLVLVVVVTLIAVGLIVSLGSKAYRVTRDVATEQFNVQQLTMARSSARGIETYFEAATAALSSLAKHPSVQRMTPGCLQAMQHTYWGFPSGTSLRFLDRDGVLRFIYPFDGWRGGLVGSDHDQEGFFQEARDRGRTCVSGLIRNESGETRIRIAVPVRLGHRTETVTVEGETGLVATPLDPGDPESGRFVGVLVGSFDPRTIANDFVSPVVSGKTGYAWLLNQEGVFLTHHEPGFVGQNAFAVRKEKSPDLPHETIAQIQRKMMAGEEGTGRYVSGWHRGQEGEVEKLIAYTPVRVADNAFSVAVCAPVREVEETLHLIRRSEQYVLGFVIVLLVVCALTLLAISYRWSRSLERKVAVRTKKLRETGDYLDKLIRYANAPIVVWNPARRVTIFNKAFEGMSGWSEAQIMEQPVDVLFPEDRRVNSVREIARAFEGEHWESVEIPIQRRDGEIRWGLWNSANIRGEDGETVIATIAQGQDITERKRADERLRLLSSSVEQSSEGISVIDLEGSLLFVNKACANMHGFAPEELAGEHQSIFHAPGQMAAVEAANREIREAGDFSGEIWHARRDGTAFPGLVHNSLLRDESGEPIAMIGTLRDITEWARTQEALRESERRFQDVARTTGDWIWETDAEGRYTYSNPLVEQLLGYAPEEVLGKHYSEFFHPDERETLGTRTEEAFRKREPFVHLVNANVHKDGHTVVLETTGLALTDDESTLLGYRGVDRDVTATTQAREALERRATQLATLGEVGRQITSVLELDHLLDRIVNLIREAFRYRYVTILLVDQINGDLALRAAAGYDAESVRALHLKLGEEGICGWVAGTGEPSLVGDVSRSPQYRMMGVVADVRSELAVPIQVKGRTLGVLDVQSSELDAFDEDDLFTLESLADQAATAIDNARLFEQAQQEIAERKQAEDALRKSEEQLRQAQKIEAVGQLAGGVAHDFNNLLTAILGHADLSLMDLPENHPVHKQILQIRHSAVRAADLTRKLLLFSRRHPVALGPLDLNTLIEDLMTMLHRLIGENISARTDLGEGLCTIKADAGNIELVIMNLVVNARDAIPDEGEILVRTENVSVDKEYCRAHLEATPGDFVGLTVADTGVGMEEETLRHVFEPFFTTKGPGTGTGLGLAVVYGIVKQHNGWIAIESAPGQGTRFQVFLPVTSKVPPKAEEAPASPEAFLGKGERILVVEDEESVRNFAVEALTGYGYVVFTAGSMQEALDVFEKEEGEFDLLFCDVVLPDGRGPHLAERLFSIRPGIPVVFTSGYMDDKQVWQALRESGHPYVQKPYQIYDLLEVMREALRDRGRSD